jgi:hypothetical protein
MQFGRSNLVVASKRYPFLFFGHDDMIVVRDTPTSQGVCRLSPYKRIIKRPYPDDASEGYIEKDKVHPLQYPNDSHIP